MNELARFVTSAILMGLGATLVFDLWGWLLKAVFKIAPSNICLVGRWLRYMAEGTFTHANITAAPRKRAECTVGWIAHYTIGVMFALGFVAWMGKGWLEHPTPLPALLYGVVTVLAPFCIMQPAMGLGFAASKTVHPWQARVRSGMNHAAFGAGLYLFGWLVSGLG